MLNEPDFWGNCIKWTWSKNGKKSKIDAIWSEAPPKASLLTLWEPAWPGFGTFWTHTSCRKIGKFFGQDGLGFWAERRVSKTRSGRKLTWIIKRSSSYFGSSMPSSRASHPADRSKQSKDEVKFSRFEGYLLLLPPERRGWRAPSFPRCTYSENWPLFAERIFDHLTICYFEPDLAINSGKLVQFAF